MQIIKRKVKEVESEIKDLLYVGYNSNGVLSFVFEDGLINFQGGELNKIREFLNKIDD